jgi:hypothetical protein
MATDDTLRSTVGRDADVPRRRMLIDMASNIANAWNRFCGSLVHDTESPQDAKTIEARNG